MMPWERDIYVDYLASHRRRKSKKKLGKPKEIMANEI